MGAARRRLTPVMAMIGKMWKGFAALPQFAKNLDEFVHMPQPTARQNSG
jgi:hypothetical protein